MGLCCVAETYYAHFRSEEEDDDEEDGIITVEDPRSTQCHYGQTEDTVASKALARFHHVQLFAHRGGKSGNPDRGDKEVWQWGIWSHDHEQGYIQNL